MADDVNKQDNEWDDFDDLLKPDSGFYITGGTLPLDADSYIVRRADAQLMDGLQKGHFCYILHTRQMGKSSMVVRTARRLREEGCQVAILDLTAFGQNVTVDQWYYGLLTRTAAQTGSRAEMVAFWKANPELGPMQRYIEALRHVLLERDRSPDPPVHRQTTIPVPSTSRGFESRSTYDERLVIFIDEIDVVRSLPFSVDEFFAGIRECYNRRSQDPVFERLTFCLVGVAAPTDLVQDTRISPFNIGQRIELSDFTEAEAARLAKGLLPPSATGSGSADNEPGPDAAIAKHAVGRVIYWTNGHPYLTQRLCQAVAHDKSGQTLLTNVTVVRRVDRRCRELFLTDRAQQSDPNLTFVRNRLLQSEADNTALLELYRQVHRGRHHRALNDAANPLCSLLQLSGIVAASGEWLVRRNRIYDTVFNTAWINNQLPGAELRRQKIAFRRGVWRTALAGGVVVLCIGVLALVAVRQAQVAREQARLARRAEERASEQEGMVRTQLSQKYVETALRLMNAGDYGAALSPVAQAADLDKNDPDRLAIHQRRFAYLAAAVPRIEKFWSADEPINWATFSPDKTLVAAGGEDGIAHLWDATTGAEQPLQAPPTSAKGSITWGAFSPDGTRLIVCGDGNAAPVWDVKTRKLLGMIRIPPHGADGPRGTHVSWSHDGQQIATARGEQATVWRVAGARASFGAPRFVMTDNTPNAFLNEAAFSPDGKLLALAFENNSGWVLALPHDKPQFRIGSPTFGTAYHATHAVWSSDGKRLLIAGAFVPKGPEIRGVGVFDGKQNVGENFGRELLPLLSHSKLATWAVFSPDETRIATASEDGTARIWNAQTGRPITPPLVHEKDKSLTRVTFSPSGKYVAAAGIDGTVQVWNATTGAAFCAPLHHAGAVVAVEFKDDAHLLTASRDGTVRVWSIAPPAPLLHFDGDKKLYLYDNDTWLVETLCRDTLAYANRIYDFPTGRLQITRPGDLRGMTGSHRFVTDIGRYLPFLPSGDKNKAPGNVPKNVRVWDAEAERFVFPPLPADWAILSHDEKAVLLHKKNDFFQLCDVVTGKPLLPAIQGAVKPDDGMNSITDVLGSPPFTPDDRYLVLCPTPSTLRFFDRRTGQPYGTPMLHNTPVRSWSFSLDGRYLFTDDTKGNLRMWNVSDGSPASASYPSDNGGWERVVSPNGRFVLSNARQGIHFWPLDGGIPITPRKMPMRGLTDFVISPDSASFVALHQTKWLWRVGADSPTAVDTQSTSKVILAVFSPDSRRVFAVREDGSALFCDARTARPLTPPLAQTQIDHAAFSPDGKLLATGTSEGIVRLWDAATGDSVMPPRSLKGDIHQVFFSKDGRRLLAAARGESAVWELPQVSDDAAAMTARTQLLSGQRQDVRLGSVPVDTAALRAAWKVMQRGSDTP